MQEVRVSLKPQGPGITVRDRLLPLCLDLPYGDCTSMYGIGWYGMVWYGMVWYGMVCHDCVHPVTNETCIFRSMDFINTC